MAIGKLYRVSDNEFITEVNYKFQDESETGWWGELTLTDYKRVNDSDVHIIELDDMRRGRCRLRKRVNRAVSGIPTRYVYQFTGMSALQQPE
ncbi:MAG: hypothetical protein V3W44_07645 [Dehalococcoidales bacterium]